MARALGDPEHDARRRSTAAIISRGVGDGVRDRLLARDVLAGARRRDHVVPVQVRRGEDLDGVDLVVGEQRHRDSVYAVGDAPLLRLARTFSSRGSHSATTSHRSCVEVARHVHRRDVADADDADAHAVHGPPCRLRGQVGGTLATFPDVTCPDVGCSGVTCPGVTRTGAGSASAARGATACASVIARLRRRKSRISSSSSTEYRCMTRRPARASGPNAVSRDLLRLRCPLDQHPPAIRRVRHAARELGPLEPVEDGGDTARRQPGLAGQIPGRHSPVLVEQVAAAPVGPVDAGALGDDLVERVDRALVGTHLGADLLDEPLLRTGHAPPLNRLEQSL